MINSKLIQAIQRRLDDPTGANFTGNVIADELTLTSAAICANPTIKKYLFPQKNITVTLTEDDEYVTLPADYNFQVQRVKYNPDSADSYVLRWVPLDEIDELQGQSATVAYYSVRGNQLLLAGKPSADDDGVELEILYSKKDGTYANDGNETTLGAKYPHLLINKTAWELSMTEQDGEIAASADRLKQSFNEDLNTAIQELSQQGTSESKSIRTDTTNDPL